MELTLREGECWWHCICSW